MKPILIILLLLISLSVKAPPLYAPNSPTLYANEALSTSRWTLLSTHMEKQRNTHIEKLFIAISMVESGGDSMAINKREMAYGIVQIRQIRLTDYERRTGQHKPLREMLLVSESKQIFFYYANLYYNKGDRYIIRNWNGRGSDGKGSANYYRKVLTELNKLK